MRDTSRANNASVADIPNSHRDILVYLRWPLLPLQIVGILPFYTTQGLYEIGLPNRHTIYITRAALLIKICFNILHTFYLLSPSMLDLLFLKSNTDGITNILDIALCILSDATLTWTCAGNTDKIINILNSFLKVDKLLKQVPAPTLERSLATNQFNRYLIWILGFNCIATFSYVKQSLDNFSFYFFVHTVVYLLQYAILFIFVVFISALLYLLAERFRFVNMLITQYNRKTVPNRVFSKNSLTQDEENCLCFAENSALIYSLHYDLLDVYKMINDYAGLGLLVFVLCTCCDLLICIYYLAFNICNLNDKLHYVLRVLLWLPYIVGGLVVLATNCAKVTREVSSIRCSVCLW